jgi:uncharacterized protein YecT (DUF1311 family)
MRSLFFTFRATTIFLSLTFPLVAFSEGTGTREYDACMNEVDLGSFKFSHWLSCGQEELGRQMIVLDAEYSALRKNMNAEQLMLLESFKKSWVTYREDFCRLEEQSSSSPGGELNYIFCLLDLTKSHIESLRGFLF